VSPSEEVTVQLNETGLSKLPVAVKSMMEVAASPGFTATGVRGDAVRLKSCP
jgi:hypothetical protein